LTIRIGRPWTHEDPVSYESGSNPTGWPQFETTATDVRQIPPPGSVAQRWLVEIQPCLDDADLPDGIVNHPDRIEDVVTENVATELTRLIRAAGGLPPELSGGVQILFSNQHGGICRYETTKTVDWLGPSVPWWSLTSTATTNDSGARANRIGRSSVLGIVAHAVSRILENSSNPRHPAIPELQRLVDEARDLAPFP